MLGVGRRRHRRRHDGRHRRRPPRLRHHHAGPPTTPSASSACSSCRPPSSPSRRSCAPSWWPRSAARCSSPTARSSTPRCARPSRWPAEQIDTFPWSRSLGPKDPFGMGSETEREVWKEPVGVVGVIVPWNFPIEIILNKLGPVLAMGNTCVLKPAPDTPWNATRLGRLIAEKTDIPPGVVNIVVSSDHLVGEVLTTSPDVDMVAFTGSTATGRRIMAAAVGHPEAGVPRARRQERQPVLDDADFGAVGALVVVGVLPRRPGLRHAHPVHGAPHPVRRSRRAGGRGLRRRQLRRPHRRVATSWARSCRRSSGSACSATSRRARPRAPGSSPAAACPAHLAQGLVRRADAVRRRRQLDDHRPGGDLRAGPRDDPVRRRRRRRAHRQRQRLTACRG